MSNIMDYLQWRGDVTFDQSPFNEVDNLILSQIAYVNFNGIIPGITYDEDLRLADASDLFFKMHTEKELEEDKSLIRETPLVLKLAATKERFRNIRLCNYISKLDYTEEKQFSALHYLLDDHTVYVAFRGTDDTILGWKEDFNMSFMEVVPSQIEAVNYLNETLKSTTKAIYLGGHSKGGNLAIYASVRCLPHIREHIRHIYNNDGPGFNEQMIENPTYQLLLDRITTIVPESSFIGMLLEHKEHYKVVKSKQMGLLQHDAMSWEVLGPCFVTCEELSKGSQILDHTITSWLTNLDAAQRELFIETLYNILETTGAKTVSDLSTSRLKKINTLIKSYNAMDDATKLMLSETIKLLTTSYYQVFTDSLLPKPIKQMTQSITHKHK